MPSFVLCNPMSSTCLCTWKQRINSLFCEESVLSDLLLGLAAVSLSPLKGLIDLKGGIAIRYSVMPRELKLDPKVQGPPGLKIAHTPES